MLFLEKVFKDKKKKEGNLDEKSDGEDEEESTV